MPTKTKSKLRVLLLTHPDNVPPRPGESAKRTDDGWKVERGVMKALRSLGHEPDVLGIYDCLDGLRAKMAEWRPHIVFNLLEEFDGNSSLDQNVVSYLELAGIPYTGCNPKGLMLARQKAIAKLVLAHEGIRTPQFKVYPKGQAVRPPQDFPLPWFVKSLTEEASLGISQESIVRTPKAFLERVRFIHESVGSPALAEHYIEGRELYVGLVGNRRTETFPIWELKFRKAPGNLPRIATRKVKFNPAYQRKYGITSGPAAGLSSETTGRIQSLSKRIFAALGMNGYGRLDLRLTSKGEIYFLEANPNPHIGRQEDFAQAALRAGLSYPELMDRILRLGLRWQSARLEA